MNEQTSANTGYLKAERLLEEVFPDKASRPSVRWLRDQQKRRSIPFIKLGHGVFFDPNQVREAINKKTVRERALSAGLSKVRSLPQ